MLDKIRQLFCSPDLRKRILIIGLLFVVFRILTSIPIPGVNETGLKKLLETNQSLGYLNIFSGGALEKLSVAMLGVGPYITATIILQLLTMIFPKLKEIYYEEGAIGREKFERLGRYVTLPLAALQAYAFLNYLAFQGVFEKMNFLGLMGNVIVITAGSMIVLWLGELISEQKLGNGISLIIFAGIVSDLPASLGRGLQNFALGTLRIDTVLIFLALALTVIAGVVIVNDAERKIPVSYAKRVRGNKMYGGVSTYLPLRLNQAGVIPIIFAISVLLFPQFFGQIFSIFSPTIGTKINDIFQDFTNNHFLYGLSYFILVFIFTYFYTAIVFNAEEISKNLQRSGGFIPGIRPGLPTAHYLSAIISRITLFGAVFLGMIAVLPVITQRITGTSFSIGGTALLIVVSVALETAKQLDSELKVREYEV
jgi:preprotein translocase subunit SecY